MNRHLHPIKPRHAHCAFLVVMALACSEDPAAPAPAVLTPFVVLDQPSFGNTQGLYADDACGASGCTGTTEQSAADNFVLTRAATITTITILGGYFPNDVPVATDTFTVILRSDNAGAPGASVHTQTVAAPRLRTGAAFGTIDEYEYVLRLQAPQLTAGTYWVELFNETTGNTSNFTWRRGTLASTGGVAGVMISATAPGTTWSAPSIPELTVRIEAY